MQYSFQETNPSRLPLEQVEEQEKQSEQVEEVEEQEERSEQVEEQEEQSEQSEQIEEQEEQSEQIEEQEEQREKQSEQIEEQEEQREKQSEYVEEQEEQREKQSEYVEEVEEQEEQEKQSEHVEEVEDQKAIAPIVALVADGPADIFQYSYSRHKYNLIDAKKFLGKTFYKIMSSTMNNRGYQYVIGRNKLEEQFIPNADCCGGGFYFCGLECVMHWIHLYEDGLICEITIPEDAKIIGSHEKYKTDTLVVSNPVSYHEFFHNHPHMHENLITRDANNLRYIVDQCEKLCLRAVIRDPDSLRYVKEQTEYMCISAIRQDKSVSKYVKQMTPKIQHMIEGDDYYFFGVTAFISFLAMAAILK